MVYYLSRVRISPWLLGWEYLWTVEREQEAYDRYRGRSAPERTRYPLTQLPPPRHRCTRTSAEGWDALRIW